MTRLQTHLAALRDAGQPALGLFVTNGFPDPAGTADVLDACADAGADFVELGMPFSDPLAEGLPDPARERARTRPRRPDGRCVSDGRGVRAAGTPTCHSC